MPTPRLTRLRRRIARRGGAAVIAIAMVFTALQSFRPATSVAATASPASQPSAAPGPPVVDWTTARPTTSPPALTGAVAAYDPDPGSWGTGTVVLVGDGTAGAGGQSSQTWIWNGISWANGPPVPGVSGLEYASMEFDSYTNQLVLFGGREPDGTIVNDTWVWTGASWYEQSGLTTCPPARYAAGLALDPSGNLVLYGGTGYATNQSTPATTSAPPASTVPPNGCGSVSASSTQALGDTWQWTGTGWVQSAASGPPAVSGESLSYDSADDLTVLFGGAGSDGSLSGQTWTWNGSQWKQQSPKTAPPPRSAAVLTDLPTLGGVLLVGGSGLGGTQLSDTWLWSGTNWSEPQGIGSYSALSSATGAFDSTTSRLVVFGDTTPPGGAGVTELAEAFASSGTALPTTTTTAPATPPASGRAKTPTASPHTTTTVATPPPGLHPIPPRASAGLSLETSERTVKSGTAVRLSGSGFRPGATITLTFHSKPYLLGRITATGAGGFALYVEVPASVSPGRHHFEATGRAPDGKMTTLLASVLVVASGGRGVSTAVKAILSGMALLFPAAAWVVLSGVAWRRRRSGNPAANAVRDPTIAR